MSGKRQLKNKVLPALVVLGLAAYQYYNPGNGSVDNAVEEVAGVVEQAFAARRSGLWLETSGHIQRLLPDDNEGSRHQRFILKLAGGHTVMVAHNIDLAKRIPARKGDLLRLRGRYEWNDRGGVIHWTHHDPDGSSAGGWIRVGDVSYR